MSMFIGEALFGDGHEIAHEMATVSHRRALAEKLPQTCEEVAPDPHPSASLGLVTLICAFATRVASL